MTTGNGFTQKEMLVMILEGQKEINKQIDELHEKVNTKIGRQELFGWIVAVGALSALVGNLMWGVWWLKIMAMAVVVVAAVALFNQCYLEYV